MVVVEEVQLDVRPDGGPALHGLGADGDVARALEDLNGDVEPRLQGVISRGILVQTETDRHHAAETVVKDVERIGASPFFQTAIAKIPQTVP